MSWRSDELETRCGRESHHPAEGAFGTPDWVWRPVDEKMLGWEHVSERLGPQAPGWAIQENENDTWRCPEGLGRSICCSLYSVSYSLSHTTFQIKWEVYFFLKKSSLVVNIVPLWFCMYMHIYVYVLHRQNSPYLSNDPCVCVCVYIYIYIFTNLLSTSIHGYQEKRKKNPPGTRDKKISRITARGKKKKYHRTKNKKKRPTPSHQLKKIKRYAVSWSKEK